MALENRRLIGIVLLSAAIKLLFAMVNPVINLDGVVYIQAARQIAAGNFQGALEIYPMPLFPLLIALVHYLVNDWVAAARLLSITAALATLFPLYLLSRELFGSRAARWSCLVYAIAPLPNEWAMDVIRGPLFIFCFAWAVFHAARSTSRLKLIDPFLALVWGLAAVLFRIEGIVLLPLLALTPIFLLLIARDPAEVGHWRRVVLIWLLLPAAAAVAGGILAATGAASFNRLNEVGREIQAISQLTFLDNYQAIYDAFKGLEGTPPFSSLSQNILAITRHYMAVIYGVGLLESLFRVLFPMFAIPLFWGMRRPWPRPHRFVLTLLGAYLLLLYYILIERDYLQYRFVFAPVLLLYPFAGCGLERIWGNARNHSRARLFTIVCAVCFVLIPLMKTGGYIFTQDGAIRQAGQWLGAAEEWRRARVLTTDARITFYAGKEAEAELFLSFRAEPGIYAALENRALETRADLIAVKSREDEAPHGDFRHYRLLKSFKGRKDWIYIYQTVKG